MFGEVGEGGARINEAEFKLFRVLDKVVVDLHAHHVGFKVFAHVQRNPSNVVDEAARGVVTSDLNVPAIFAQAHREHPFLDQPLLVHHIVDWFEHVGVLAVRDRL